MRVLNDFRVEARRLFVRWLCAVIVLASSACASLPPAVGQAPSQAIASTGDTALGRIALVSSPDADLTGFRLIPGGDFALHTRLDLVRRAERTLDVQYYHIASDATGRYFLRALRDAARRGVRVRLLLDDLYTAGEDELLLGLAATPNLELRLFNPFPAGRGSLKRRFAASLFDFERVNRRMHNKLFIADGALAISGGRNIGDVYFRRATDANFLDVDTLVAGALLPRLGELFDLYWNSEHVRSIGSIVASDVPRDELEAGFERATGPAGTPAPRAPAPNDVLGYAPLTDEFETGRLDLIWATAEAYADDPARVVGTTRTYGGVPLLDIDSVRYNVREQMRRSRVGVTMVSPYLIPREIGLEVMREMRERNVQISIVTNSFASTDEPLVFGAYRRYRPDMLRLDVEIWELGATRARSSIRLGVFGSKIGRLHAKTVIFDGHTLYLGSMNLDPRSDIHNTEIGLFIDSPELAQQMQKLVDALKQQGAYRVRLAPNGSDLEWVGGEGASTTVLSEEPDSDFWSRLYLDLVTPLVPENLL